MLGTQNLHEISGDVSGPTESTDNAIVCWDGSTGDLTKNSNVYLDDSNNLTGVKSISFVNSASNPGASGIAWFNARSGVLNIGSNEVIDSNSAQAVTNKMITGHTNLINASNLQTTGTSVDVSSATPPTAGDVLTATSPTTAEWLPFIVTPNPTAVGSIALWGDTTGGELTGTNLLFTEPRFGAFTISNGTFCNVKISLNNEQLEDTGMQHVLISTTTQDNPYCIVIGSETLKNAVGNFFDIAIGARSMRDYTGTNSFANNTIGSSMTNMVTGQYSVGIGFNIKGPLV